MQYCVGESELHKQAELKKISNEIKNQTLPSSARVPTSLKLVQFMKFLKFSKDSKSVGLDKKLANHLLERGVSVRK